MTSPSRQFWIELKNMCAWNMDEKPAPHRLCIHVIEMSAFLALQQQADKLAEVYESADAKIMECQTIESVRDAASGIREAIAAYKAYKGES